MAARRFLTRNGSEPVKGHPIFPRDGHRKFPSRRQFSGLGGDLGPFQEAGLDLLLQAVAVAPNGKGDAVMEQSIQDGRGDHRERRRRRDLRPTRGAHHDAANGHYQQHRQGPFGVVHRCAVVAVPAALDRLADDLGSVTRPSRASPPTTVDGGAAQAPSSCSGGRGAYPLSLHQEHAGRAHRSRPASPLLLRSGPRCPRRQSLALRLVEQPHLSRYASYAGQHAHAGTRSVSVINVPTFTPGLLSSC